MVFWWEQINFVGQWEDRRILLEGSVPITVLPTENLAKYKPE